jgi:hypothetical protein
VSVINTNFLEILITTGFEGIPAAVEQKSFAVTSGSELLIRPVAL